MVIKAIPNSGGGKSSGGLLDKPLTMFGMPAQQYLNSLKPTVIPKAPGGTAPALKRAPQASGGPSAQQRAASAAASAAAAAESRAKAAGKAQSQKENEATQGIIDALLRGANQFAGGRDLQVQNADRALNAGLSGVNANYKSAITDYLQTGKQNDEDEGSKTAANLANRARERMSLLEQAASMGAGESDQLRTILQAFQNADANQLEITRSFFDTNRSIDSQIQGAGSQAATSRRSAWEQNQEAKGNAWNEFFKNYTDTWTNIQRTAAQNSNIDSDYSTGFNANLGGKNAVDEASRYVGQTYKTEDKDDTWYNAVDGRIEGREAGTNRTNLAAATAIKAPKAAEGATLRRK